MLRFMTRRGNMRREAKLALHVQPRGTPRANFIIEQEGRTGSSLATQKSSVGKLPILRNRGNTGWLNFKYKSRNNRRRSMDTRLPFHLQCFGQFGVQGVQTGLHTFMMMCHDPASHPTRPRLVWIDCERETSISHIILRI
jgi:hypothetical protein